MKRFRFAWLLAFWIGAARAQAPAPTPPPPAAGPPPAAAAPRALSVEERLQRLEQANQQLLEQNRRLSQQVQVLSRRAAPSPPPQPPGAGDESAPPPPVAPTPPGGDDDLGREPGSMIGGDDFGREPSTMSAVGGGSLIESPPPGPSPIYSAGRDTLPSDPTTMSAYGGGTLISRYGDDVTNLPMRSRFGTRFLNNGLWFESEDKRFQIHIGGRLQMDTAMFQAPADVQYGAGGIGKLRDGVDARRARIRLEGQIYEQMQFVSEFDFVNSYMPSKPPLGPTTTVVNTPATTVPVPLDIWWGFRSVPLIGNLRIGNQKEPFGFERLMSSRFLNFMERSFNQEAFYSPWSNGFSPGVQIFNTAANNRVTWALGVFKNITNPYVYDIGGGNYAETGRITWAPIYADDGSRVLHFGLSGRQSAINGGIDRLRARGPERAGLSALWPSYASTPTFRASGGQQDVNLELVSVLGPVTLQAEYDFHFIQNASLPAETSVGTLFYQGGYVELSYFLTGEHRAYIRESALFDRVVPRKNGYLVKKKNGDGCEAGPGAWQIGMRYNYLNLDNKGINGGVLNDLTFGLTWFINPNWKYQWNYSLTDRHLPGESSDGWIQGFGMRVAFDY